MGCALAGCAGTAAADEGRSVAEGAAEYSQYGFLIDVSKCVGCRNCVDACRKRNHLTEDTPDRRHVEEYWNSRREKVYVSTSCMHCADPNCVRVCPAGAISKGACGIVSVAKDKCIGCKYCFAACPYEVPSYDSEGMDKCDGCKTAGLPAGSEPYCVQACKFGALKWGAIDALRGRYVGARSIGEPGNPSCLILAD